MAVIVHPNENIDSALKRLHREVLREQILQVYRDNQYFVSPASLDAAKRKEWKKRKKRRRAAARRAQN